MAIATKKSGNETYKVGYSFLKHLFWYIENPSWVVGYTRSQVIKHFLVLVGGGGGQKKKTKALLLSQFISFRWIDRT